MTVRYKPKKKLRPDFAHNCPRCTRRIRWALTYCTRCSWNGKPIENMPWVEYLMINGKVGKSYGYVYN